MESITTARLFDLERRVKALEDTLNQDIWGEACFEQQMVKEHGTHVTKTDAARILGVCRETVYNMINDGRLKSAREGRRVDTRSIARYMSATNQRGDDDDR